MEFFKGYVSTIASALGAMKVTTKSGDVIDQEEGISRWCSLTHQVQKNNATVFFVGNGASAMMASHMAADATKNGGIRSLAFNDAALMTAVSNDIAYEECFAMPLKRFATAQDVLVTISSSGNSPNVLQAIRAAYELGMQVITVSGMKPDNNSRSMGDLNFYVPAETYGCAEAAHQLLLHCWLDKFMMEANT